ncbi:unnamed protein product [Ectocarpus sp. 6 AP-2014]
MTSPAAKTPGLEASNDPLDTLLARLLASTSEGSDDDSKGVAGVPKTSARGPMRAGSRVEDHDPWKALSDQVNDEISRQIFDDLDKQLDAQMMAELEKCQEEQSRLMDEELDRQIQEQLDAMLDANLGSELRDDQDGYDYYSDEDEYSSDEEGYEIERLPWSEGGEGGIGSLGLGESENGASSCEAHMFGAPKYTKDELDKMVDLLYGEGGAGKQVGPGAWGRGSWRPRGDKS